MGVWYTTREAVKRAGDVAETARTDGQVDRTIEASSRGIEGLLHRRFYPETGTRYFDWPNPNRPRPWRLWLDDNDLISVTTLVAGGVTISSSDYFLRRSDNRDEPPYRYIEIDLSSTAAFASGDTHQRAIAITGVWGYSNTERTVETITADIASTTAGTISVHNSADIGVGDILRVDNERMTVTGRAWADTGGGIGDDLAASTGADTVAVDVGAHFHVGETILIGAERMLVVDTVTDFLTVKRAWDGTILAAHLTGASVYRSTTLSVDRGVLGTTAATHTSGATVYRHVPPPAITTLCIAETLNTLEQESAGYARTAGGGDATRPAPTGGGIDALRSQAYTLHGRKARTRAV